MPRCSCYTVKLLLRMRLEDFRFLLKAFLEDESVKQLSNVATLTARTILYSVLFNYTVTGLILWDFSLFFTGFCSRECHYTRYSSYVSST